MLFDPDPASERRRLIRDIMDAFEEKNCPSDNRRIIVIDGTNEASAREAEKTSEPPARKNDY